MYYINGYEEHEFKRMDDAVEYANALMWDNECHYEIIDGETGKVVWTTWDGYAPVVL